MKREDFTTIITLGDAYEYTENYISLDDAKEAEKEIKKELKALGIGEKEYLELDDLIDAVSTTHLDQGFINGFRFAMQFQKECGML